MKKIEMFQLKVFSIFLVNGNLFQKYCGGMVTWQLL